jgi:hypothetical protein
MEATAKIGEEPAIKSSFPLNSVSYSSTLESHHIPVPQCHSSVKADTDHITLETNLNDQHTSHGY